MVIRGEKTTKNSTTTYIKHRLLSGTLVHLIHTNILDTVCTITLVLCRKENKLITGMIQIQKIKKASTKKYLLILYFDQICNKKNIKKRRDSWLNLHG